MGNGKDKVKYHCNLPGEQRGHLEDISYLNLEVEIGYVVVLGGQIRHQGRNKIW